MIACVFYSGSAPAANKESFSSFKMPTLIHTLLAVLLVCCFVEWPFFPMPCDFGWCVRMLIFSDFVGCCAVWCRNA